MTFLTVLETGRSKIKVLARFTSDPFWVQMCTWLSSGCENFLYYPKKKGGGGSSLLLLVLYY